MSLTFFPAQNGAVWVETCPKCGGSGFTGTWDYSGVCDHCGGTQHDPIRFFYFDKPEDRAAFFRLTGCNTLDEYEQRKEMTPKEYVQNALRTEAPVQPVADRIASGDIAAASNIVRLLHAAMGLCTETGEIQDAIKRHLFYGKELDRINLVEEMGDVLWYLAILSDYLEVNFEEVMAVNIAKLRARFPQKFTEDDALNRDLEHERSVLDWGDRLDRDRD